MVNDRIKMAVEDSGLKQKHIAERIGMSEPSLSALLTGNRQDELRKQAKTATDPDERNALARELVKAFEADGKARLRQYAARSVFEPDCALEPIEFAAIVKRLYARDRLSA